MGLDEDLHQHRIHRLRLGDDLLVTVLLPRFLRRQLQPVERALPRQRLAPVLRPPPPRTARVFLVRQKPQQGVGYRDR
jgi:hypothetical protein